MLPVLASLAFASPQADARLDDIARESAMAAVKQFEKYKVQPEQIGISIRVIDRNAARVTRGGYRADEPMYPASVVKLFYSVYAVDQLASGKLKLTPEFERAIKDMIVDSSNDATGLVLDVITDTTGGAELSESELAKWMEKRRVVNRWYTAKGYTKLNANQKTWNEGPYGRERQGYGPNFEYRNSLTPEACSRLMADVALNETIKQEHWQTFHNGLLKRVIPAEGKADVQSADFLGAILGKGTILHSKAGFTSTVRHDVAWIRFPNGHEYSLAIFTRGQSSTPGLLQFIGKSVLTRLGEGAHLTEPAPNESQSKP